MDNTSLLIENFAPWLTAVGAFIFGIMSHRRSDKASEHDRAQRAIEELHGIYHQLVADLVVQIDRLNEKNDELRADNLVLQETIDRLEKQLRRLNKKLDALTP